MRSHIKMLALSCTSSFDFLPLSLTSNVLLSSNFHKICTYKQVFLWVNRYEEPITSTLFYINPECIKDL